MEYHCKSKLNIYLNIWADKIPSPNKKSEENNKYNETYNKYNDFLLNTINKQE